MGRNRKTDKGRDKEGRGKDSGIKYKPWILPHEFPSNGRTHKIIGWKYNRVYYLMSDLELYYFLILQMQDNVIDIREQFPLKPITETLKIAEKYGIIHQPIFKKNGNEKTVMTSDFNILINTKEGTKEIVRTIKTMDDLRKIRTQEKFFIEKKYWESRNVDWGIVTDNQISKVVGRNIYSIYFDYFWNENKGFDEDELEWLVNKFKSKLMENNNEVDKTIIGFERYFGGSDGEGINFFNYLLTHKIIKTDFNIKFNYHQMKIWF